ncbi:MAG: 50S ribosomal protein L33 [Mycoplasmataceae bacterium]|nr:50S ribosomal protein L33 [Mycoplasmataceae bacterium]
MQSNRKNIILICSECNSRNYHYEKKRTDTKKMELNKYCPICKKKTLHIETK